MNFLRRMTGGMTMYRLMLYFLIILVLAAIVLSALGALPYDPALIAAQSAYLAALCWFLNSIFARLARTRPNPESALITALILALIMGPAVSGGGFAVLAAAAALAMASKYLVVLKRSHIFNPAAFGAIAAALITGEGASWWVGSAVMLPLILAGGLIVLYKIRRFGLVAVFLAAYLGLLVADGLAIRNILLSSPLLFFALVMLVEPLTSPQAASRRLYYGLFVGAALFSLQKFFPTLTFSLELSLLAGNVFFRIINPDFRQAFRLIRTERMSPNIRSFWFEPLRRFSFLPGQFLEYTLVHAGADSRGARRYFTIASAPGEENILLATRISDPGSTFKQALGSLGQGGEITASKVAGDFVLPKDPAARMAFIAGGIGITPFRSMVRHLLDTGQSRDIVLLYAARSEEDFVFRDIFEEARKRFGMRTVYHTGRIDGEFIKNEVPDMKERVFYVSGPEPMVEALASELYGLGIAKKRVRRDFFPGYTEV